MRNKFYYPGRQDKKENGKGIVEDALNHDYLIIMSFAKFN